ncbi:MAG: hypothetical protein GXX95_10435 [Methanomassiliicoccus sp.]|nr:hypothetical protein [Methanomassiliicoccus sp.]
MVQDQRPMPDRGLGWGRYVSKEADRDRLGLLERLGNVLVPIITVAVALMFLDVQAKDLGFFTSGFGTVEQLAFYGSLLFGMVPSLVRAIIGRRNLGRLMDIISSVVFITAGSYLLTVFPFDFPHLWEYLPTALEAILSWISNDMMKIFLTIAIVITAISTVYNIIMYWKVRRELRSRERDMTPPA